ncbi:MAG: hypothetical protein Tsb0021_17620 [Chlamydiales bacterium]
MAAPTPTTSVSSFNYTPEICAKIQQATLDLTINNINKIIFEEIKFNENESRIKDNIVNKVHKECLTGKSKVVVLQQPNWAYHKVEKENETYLVVIKVNRPTNSTHAFFLRKNAVLNAFHIDKIENQINLLSEDHQKVLNQIKNLMVDFYKKSNSSNAKSPHGFILTVEEIDDIAKSKILESMAFIFVCNNSAKPSNPSYLDPKIWENQLINP